MTLVRSHGFTPLQRSEDHLKKIRDGILIKITPYPLTIAHGIPNRPDDIEDTHAQQAEKKSGTN